LRVNERFPIGMPHPRFRSGCPSHGRSRCDLSAVCRFAICYLLFAICYLPFRGGEVVKTIIGAKPKAALLAELAPWLA
jgi:hypothetical protein